MTDYNAELQALQEKLTRKAKLQAMIDSLQYQLRALEVAQQNLLIIRDREQADVDSLEKPSLSSFFYAIVNKKEEKLEKEKAEAYAAAVKYESTCRQVEAARRDLETLTVELSDLCDVQGRYDTVFAEKTAAVKAVNPEKAAEICRVEENLGRISAQLKEIDEARSVGRSVLDKIASIENELSSAEGWGTWDLLGGGLISDMAKHAHLDDAQAKIESLQVMLRRYRTELADVTVYADIQAQVDGFLRFADYFFDGLFADWAVMESIHSAQDQVYAAKSQVQNVQSRLSQMKSGLEAEAEKLEADLRDIVLKA